MANLSDVLNEESSRMQLIHSCLELIDQEVSDKGGLSGLAIKAGYAAVKNIKPDFLKNVVAHLLPEFAAALDPIYQEAKSSGMKVGLFFETNASRVADALLQITDGRASKAQSGLVKSSYEKLRGTAKKNVEQAVPRLGKLVDKFTEKT